MPDYTVRCAAGKPVALGADVPDGRPWRLFSFRAQSVAPGILTRDALRTGMDAMNPR